MNNAGFFDPTQEAKIKQQRELAARLEKIGASTPTEMVSGGKYQFAVPKSMLESASKGIAQGLGAYETAQANEAEKEMQRTRQELLAEALSKSDLKDAAATIAQDPAMMGKALDMYGSSLENEAKNVRSDFEFQREADLKRELAGMRQGVQIDPETGELVITGKPLNASQSKADLFSSRMGEADKIIQGAGTTGTDYAERLKAAIPFGIGNMLVSPEYQKLDQAERDFVNAVLRQESGAVINQDEFDNAKKQYFPQPGDRPDVITQKARNRALAIQKMAEATGRPQLPQAVDDFDAQYEAMPSGTVFTDPNGVKRRKP